MKIITVYVFMYTFLYRIICRLHFNRNWTTNLWYYYLNEICLLKNKRTFNDPGSSIGVFVHEHRGDESAPTTESKARHYMLLSSAITRLVECLHFTLLAVTAHSSAKLIERGPPYQHLRLSGWILTTCSALYSPYRAPQYNVSSTVLPSAM